MSREISFQTPDDLLEALVKNKENLGEFVRELYGGGEDSAKGTYYNGLFGMLKDDGYVSVLFADNRAYYVDITAKGYIYASSIKKKKWKDACMSFTILNGKYREDLLKITDLYRENDTIPNDAGFNDSIRMLRIKGYLTRFTPFVNGGWGVSYTDDDLSYRLLEEDCLSRQEKPNARVNIEGGNVQFNLAFGNGAVQATQNIGVDSAKLSELIGKLERQSQNLPDEVKEAIDESVETITTELPKDKPKKNLIKTALKTLEALKMTGETAITIIELVKFVRTALGV